MQDFNVQVRAEINKKCPSSSPICTPPSHSDAGCELAQRSIAPIIPNKPTAIPPTSSLDAAPLLALAEAEALVLEDKEEEDCVVTSAAAAVETVALLFDMEVLLTIDDVLLVLLVVVEFMLVIIDEDAVVVAVAPAAKRLTELPPTEETVVHMLVAPALWAAGVDGSPCEKVEPP